MVNLALLDSEPLPDWTDEGVHVRITSFGGYFPVAAGLLCLFGCKSGLPESFHYSSNTRFSSSSSQSSTSAGGLSAPVDNRSQQKALLPPPHITVADASNIDPAGQMPDAPSKDVIRAGDNEVGYEVNVPDIDRVQAVQESDTLCWAACTQMLLRQKQIVVQQQALANAFVPDVDDQSANVGIIMRALNPELEPRLEQRDLVPIQLLGITSDQLIDRLMDGELCVVGLVKDPADDTGHACVVCGATFAPLKKSFFATIAPGDARTAAYQARPENANPNDAILASNLAPRYGLYEVELYDPEPKNHGGGKRTLTGAAFAAQVRFITSKRLAYAILEDALKAEATAVKPGQLVLIHRSAQNPRGVAVVNQNGKLQRPDLTPRPVPDGSNPRNRDPQQRQPKLQPAVIKKNKQNG